MHSRSDLHQQVAPYARKLCDECVFEAQQQAEEERQQWALQEADRAAEMQRQGREILRAQFSHDVPNYAVNQLSLEDAVYLVALSRAAASEDLDTLPPLQQTVEPIAPTAALCNEMLQHLFARKLMIICPDSAVDAFEYEDGSATRFYHYRVTWHIANAKTIAGENVPMVRSLEETFLSGDWPAGWNDQVLDLWRKIALNEALEYLDVKMREHRLEFKPGEKTRMVLQDALTTYSVAQLYNMIYRATKDAAAFYMSDKGTLRHAANTVVGNIRRFTERARAEGWKVSPYRREFKCPQSSVSKVLFDAVLGIGGGGFDQVPTSWSDEPF